MATPPFSIDADVRRARTLPARVYHDAAHYAAQKERVFARAWHFLGRADRLKAPGHVLPLVLLEGCLDEPLVLTCDEQRRVHCLSNVCTHRGALVVAGEGHERFLRCRYHGRKFALDGRFVSMPEFDETADFPAESDSLPGLLLEQWRGFLFCSLDPVMPFAEWIGPVEERVGFLPIERFQHDAARSHEYLVPANWALYVDNYSEEFHIPYVHATSLSGIDYGAYRTELYTWSTLQVGHVKPGEEAFRLPEGHADHGGRIGGYYFWLFPNLMLNFYPWGLSVNVVMPLAPDRTKVAFRSYVQDPAKLGVGAGADPHRVEMEDEEVVESVQRGVRSRLYDRGRYSPRRETGTHHFHRLLAQAMNESEVPGP
ncbi:MAG: aromatic ring-hydroxylating oxygenase subunit alpha [Longimicrobiales bacterium]